MFESEDQNKGLPRKICEKAVLAHEFWGDDPRTVSGLELHSGGTEPVTFFGAQSSLEGQNSRLGVSGLELHSSGTEPVTFFGAQSSLEGQNSRLGAQAVIWGARSQWRRAWIQPRLTSLHVQYFSYF